MSILSMSLSSSVFIIVVVVVRTLKLNFISKRQQLFLWCVAMLGLLIPIRITSKYNIYAIIKKLNIGHYAEAIHADSGNLMQNISINEKNSVTIMLMLIVWGVGFLSVMSFFLISHFTFRKLYKMALPISANITFIEAWKEKNKTHGGIKILMLDRVSSPLTYGIWKPVIILPKTVLTMEQHQIEFILNHESVHIRHFHIILKWGFCLCVCIHWFNPIVWLAYFLANKDIELFCDAQVLSESQEYEKAEYALTLIHMESVRNNLSPFCNGFSRNFSEERIIAIMKNKKISKSGQIFGIVFVLGIVISFATVAKGDTKTDTQGDSQTLSFFEEKFVPEEVDSSIPLLELRQDSSDGTYSVIAKDNKNNVVLEESNIVFEGEKTLLQIYEKILNTNGEKDLYRIN